MSRLWDKGSAVNDLALRFTVGDDYLLDARLAEFDVEGSVAHAKCLEASGLISWEELEQLLRAYELIRGEIHRGELTVSIEQEDCHTAIEMRMTALLGPLGAKIHAGRSRNDQVVTMLRLAMRHGLQQAVRAIAELVRALLRTAERGHGISLPGYTHMQRAMPSSVAAWALGYAEVLCERAEALVALRGQLARSALGSAAGYGTPIRLARQTAAESMGFDRVQAVTSVQLTRGLDELCVVQALGTTGVVVSRMAADLVLFATKEYGFAKLPAELTTGSSIMPNKANPDLFELMRAKGAALAGHASPILNVLCGMPGGYQRDLQIIKRSLVAALDESHVLFEAATLAVDGVRFVPEACSAALSDELYATAAAYARVRAGMPFREAYKLVAKDTDSWRAARQAGGMHEAGADAADSAEYTRRLAGAIEGRAIRLDDVK